MRIRNEWMSQIRKPSSHSDPIFLDSFFPCVQCVPWLKSLLSCSLQQSSEEEVFAEIRRGFYLAPDS
jgi:hypothetical protein